MTRASRLARPFEFGRFARPGPAHVYTVTRVDLGARRIWLPGEYVHAKFLGA